MGGSPDVFRMQAPADPKNMQVPDDRRDGPASAGGPR